MRKSLKFIEVFIEKLLTKTKKKSIIQTKTKTNTEKRRISVL